VLQDVLRIVASLVSAAIAMAVAGAIAAYAIRALSRRFRSERVGWLLANLSPLEAFVFGLILASIAVAAMQSWIASADLGGAWLRYAAGSGIALVAFLTIFGRRQPHL